MPKKSSLNFENADSVAIEREITAKMNSLATREDLANVKEQIANVKADMIKWMFIFWIGQTAATFGFIILYLKK